MAGLIDSNILRNTPKRLGFASADQAMSSLRPAVTGLAPRYPTTTTQPSQRVSPGSTGVQTQPVPLKGPVAGTAQALTAAPPVAGASAGGLQSVAFDPDVFAKNDWSKPAPAFDPEKFNQVDWYEPRPGPRVSLPDATPSAPGVAPDYLMRAIDQRKARNEAIEEYDKLHPDYDIHGGAPPPGPGGYDPALDPTSRRFNPEKAAPAWVGSKSRDPSRTPEQQAADAEWERQWDLAMQGKGPYPAFRGDPNGSYDDQELYHEDEEYAGIGVDNKAGFGDNRKTWRPRPEEPAAAPVEFNPDTFMANPWGEKDRKWEEEHREKGDLEDPGDEEQNYADTKDERSKPRDPKLEAAADALMAQGGPDSRNFDEYYQNAWKHSERDINSAYAGRGMFGSGDALRALQHSRTDLAAQQSKDEADYALESMKNYIGRMAAAGQMLGTITANDQERWRINAEMARGSQRAEEGRLRGYLQDTSDLAGSMFEQVMDVMDKMTAADQQLALQLIAGLPASYADLANMDEKARAEGLAAIGTLSKLIASANGVPSEDDQNPKSHG